MLKRRDDRLHHETCVSLLGQIRGARGIFCGFWKGHMGWKELRGRGWSGVDLGGDWEGREEVGWDLRYLVLGSAEVLTCS